MPSLNPIPTTTPASSAPCGCVLCGATAVGVLMEAAIVEPWGAHEESAPVLANLRRVLKGGDPLCGVCERGVGYLPSTPPGEEGAADEDWWLAHA